MPYPPKPGRPPQDQGDTPPGPGRHPPGPGRHTPLDKGDTPWTRQNSRDQADTPPAPGRPLLPPGDQADPPQPPPGPGRPPNQADPPPGTRQTPPREADSSIQSTSGRYASYWNAFLFRNELSVLSSGGSRDTPLSVQNFHFHAVFVGPVPHEILDPPPVRSLALQSSGASLALYFIRQSSSPLNFTNFWQGFLPPANEVFEGYVFTGVCLSTGGMSVPLHAGIYPLGPVADTPQSRHPHGSRHTPSPWEQTPAPSPGSAYWNAYLFFFIWVRLKLRGSVTVF